MRKEVAHRGSLHTHQQTVWELPDESRVPVAKHPGFGRYFWALFEAAAGRDLMTSFDRPRAESPSALTPKLVAASATTTIPKDPNSDFAPIVEPLSVAPEHYQASREIERQTRPLRLQTRDEGLLRQSSFKHLFRN
jgi:hypothetical protein